VVGWSKDDYTSRDTAQLLRDAAARVRELEDALREIVAIFEDPGRNVGEAAYAMRRHADLALREGGNG
jgi:hypothetical protein